MSHAPLSPDLSLLSRTSLPIDEYILTRSILQSRPEVSVLLNFGDWHCLSQCCAVILKCFTGHEQEIQTWLQHYPASRFVSCDRHCSCKIFHLMTHLQPDTDLIHSFDAFMRLCSKNRTCFLLPCIRTLGNAVNLCASDQQKFHLMERLQALRKWLPHLAVNFVGEDIVNTVQKSAELRAYAHVCLEIIAAVDHAQNDWKKQQIFNLTQTIEKEMDTTNDSVNRMIELFEDDDEKLISATKYMMQILRDLSDYSAVHDLIHQFMNAFCFDYKVLMDWMTSDADTSVEVLSLLMSYLKLDGSGISGQVRQVLIQLRTSVHTLAQRDVFPYNAEPLLRLMRDL